MRVTAPLPRARAGAQRSWLRQRWLLLPITLVLFAAAALWWLRSSSATTAASTTATVSQGQITVAVSGSGTAAAARTVGLPFQQSGTVTEVLVRVGDQVRAGQTLARIDPGELQLQLQQARANLRAAQAALGQVRSGSATPQDLKSAQAQLDSAEAQLQQARAGSATRADIQSAQAQLDAAQAKLSALRNPTPAEVSAAQMQVSQAQTNLQTSRDSLSQAKSSAYTQMQQAVNALTQAQSKYATAAHNWQYVQDTGNDPTQPSKTDASGKSADNKLSDTQRQQYYDAYVQAEAALRNAEQALQQAQVNYDAARQKEAAEIPLAERQVANAQAQLDALLHPSADALRQAQAQVTQAQASLTKLRQGGAAADIAQAQAQVTQAQASLEKLTAPATEQELAAAEAGVLQAQVQVDTAQRALGQAELKAPFDGVVSAVALQAGSPASAGAAAVTLVDRSKLHIDVSLSETDAAKVQVGQPVRITFDALPTAVLTGTVATIAPAATVQQNVVTYPVQVEFDPGDAPVKVGMSASADIQIQQIDRAILVPSRAVQTAAGRRTITVLQGGDKVPVEVEVEVGPTSAGQTMIAGCVATGAQCLKAGDLVAVPRTTTATATQSGNRRSGFGGPPFGP